MRLFIEAVRRQPAFGAANRRERQHRWGPSREMCEGLSNGARGCSGRVQDLVDVGIVPSACTLIGMHVQRMARLAYSGVASDWSDAVKEHLCERACGLCS